MIEVMFLVPVRDNTGGALRRQFWRMLRQRLRRTFGRYSERRNVVGSWTHAGRVYRDRSREFTVAITSWAQLPAWLALIEWVRVEARQEALYIRVAGIPEIWTGG
jgi:hypothetical protein